MIAELLTALLLALHGDKTRAPAKTPNHRRATGTSAAKRAAAKKRRSRRRK